MRTAEEIQAEVDALAREVTDEHPEWNVFQRMSFAMQKCKGHLNPTMVCVALKRLDDGRDSAKADVTDEERFLAKPGV